MEMHAQSKREVCMRAHATDAELGHACERGDPERDGGTCKECNTTWSETQQHSNTAAAAAILTTLAAAALTTTAATAATATTRRR